MSDRYRIALMKLMPTGAAWARAATSQLYMLLDALAIEFQRVEDRAWELLSEAIPSTATESLPEWEEMVGIIEIAATTSDRRGAIQTKMLGYVDPHHPFALSTYQAIAAGFGRTLTIALFSKPFYVGIGAMGDPVGDTNYNSTYIVTVSGAPDAAFEAAIRTVSPQHILFVYNYV